MLVCMLRRVLGGSLLLSCVATLGYCVKQLGSWMLGAIKASILCTARALPWYCWGSCCWNTARGRLGVGCC